MPVPLVSVRNCDLKPIQPACRHPELEPYAAAAVVDHLAQHTAPHAGLGDHHPLVHLGHVDHQVFDRFHLHAIDLPSDDVRTRHLELVRFAAHHLDEDRKVQLAPADDLHLLGGVGVLHAERDVTHQFAHQTVAEIARRDVLSRPSRPSGRC